MQFERRDMLTSATELVVSYHLLSEMYTGEISASRNGVAVSGTWPVMLPADAARFEHCIARARIQAGHLATIRVDKPYALSDDWIDGYLRDPMNDIEERQ